MRTKIALSLLFFYLKSLAAGEIIELGKIRLSESTDILSQLGFGNIEEINVDETNIYLSETIDELIESAVSIDLKTRSKFNIQNDLYIRGIGFEQNLILVDGIALNDPQTGHFNLDQPLSIYDCDSVQVFRGVSSSIFGSNAIGGAINFKTVFPSENKVRVKTIYGQKQLHIANFSLDRTYDFLNFHLSYENAKAASYRPETEFKIENFFSKLIFNEFPGSPNLIIALNKKDFGADSFYSPRFPRQEEHTRCNLYILGFDFQQPDFQFSPKFYYRRHHDKFILDRIRPDWYKNVHTNHLTGLSLPLGIDLQKLRLNLGLEFAEQDIKSTNLGKHARYKSSGFFSISNKAEGKIIYNLSLRGDNYSSLNPEFNPGIYLGYKITPEERVFLSFQRGFRIPSFTELYYSDPAHKGNPNLYPEKYWNFEIGYFKENDNLSLGCSLFTRFGYDIIDWVKNEQDSPWQAENISYLKTEGLETWFKFKSIKFSYTYLDTDYKTLANYSKYLANYLEHKFSLFNDFKFRTYSLNCHFSYQERPKRSGYFNLDLNLKKEFKLKNYSFNLFLNVSNLTNSHQEEIDGVILPGRWISSGIEFKF